MNKADIYYLQDGDSSTYQFDETLPSLPLPKLEDTLNRYYECLKPFGTEEELENSKKIIEQFRLGIGSELHKKLEHRAATQRNWLGNWWDDYAYHLLRIPLQPYVAMAMPANLEAVGIMETRENSLKNTARIIHHTLEFWDLLRTAKFKPASSNGGKIKYSSALYKRFCCTSKVPGETIDRIDQHFRSITEGDCPSHLMVIGKGRIFTFDAMNSDGTYLSAPQLLLCLQIIRSTIDSADVGDCVPLLTHDDRTSWAKNRQRLREVSATNSDFLKLAESSVITVTLDENEPLDHEDVANAALGGEFRSKWGDKSSTLISYKSGRFAYIGEHSAYDGTICISYAVFIQLSLYESPEPNWETKVTEIPKLSELKFDLDDELKSDIQRLSVECEAREHDVNVCYKLFDDFGKDSMKEWRLHPDAFIQTCIQLAYFRLHKEHAPIYETALMRHFYEGRTETLRSCTTEFMKFLSAIEDPAPDVQSIYESFRRAVNHHNHMMSEARNGNGIDRHLFGLWCAAYENNLAIPEFFSDPLYTKSGGGGNFVLSTSTLGYTVNCGYVAPMILDGYGVFYSITSEAIHLHTTVFRDSKKTSGHKFNKAFAEAMVQMKGVIERANVSKL